MQLVNYAFSSEGPFTKLLSDNSMEREGFEALLTGAFKLYRNPTAHTIIGYNGAEARGVIYLIDLSLKKLAQLSEIPQFDSLPDNVKKVLEYIEKSTNAKTANRIRVFAGKCIKEGLAVKLSSMQWISFRKQAMVRSQDAVKPKPHPVIVFYLHGTDKEQKLWFPVNHFYTNVVGFDIEPIKKELRQLGFSIAGKTQDYYLNLTTQTDQELLDRIFSLVQRVSREFEATLTV